MQSILDEVDDMTEKRMVRFSDGEKVTLNDSTLRALMPFRISEDSENPKDDIDNAKTNN